MHGRIAVFAIVLAIAAVGCAGAAWRHARSEDSISAYHAFLRDFPDSRFSGPARARLELARIKKHPTRMAVEAFREKYSAPEMLVELDTIVEDLYFQHARAQGTADSYRTFLERYPNGSFVARARGNLEYLANRGFEGDIERLASFAAEHPASDYAAEALRTVSALQLRDATSFDRIGVVVDVSPSVPGAERLRRVFRDRAAAAYASVGMETEHFGDVQSARTSNLSALLTIRYDERETPATLEKGTMAGPALVARTEVELRGVADTEPVWSRPFEYRLPLASGRASTPMLLEPGLTSADPDRQWFIPVARWNTAISTRNPRLFSKAAHAVDVAGTKAVVVFGDGDFQVFDLSNPDDLVVVAEYRRPRDLARFDGVTIHESTVATFGPDGIELVRLDGGDAYRDQAWTRDRVGSVVEAESIGGKWVLASNRGLLQIDEKSGEVETLMPRPVLGLARGPEDRIAFTDGISLFVAPGSSLRSGVVGEDLHLGRGFRPERIRGDERTAVVLGSRDAAWVDLRSLQIRSRISGKNAGRILDAVVMGERVFLIGSRGLQVAGPGGQIVDSVDVDARRRLQVAGRHLVMIGESSLQVVDATPFVASEFSPASH